MYFCFKLLAKGALPWVNTVLFIIITIIIFPLLIIKLISGKYDYKSRDEQTITGYYRSRI